MTSDEGATERYGCRLDADRLNESYPHYREAKAPIRRFDLPAWLRTRVAGHVICRVWSLFMRSSHACDRVAGANRAAVGGMNGRTWWIYP